MAQSLDKEIESLRAVMGSERDPDGRAFVSLADAHRRSGDLDRAAEVIEEGLSRHGDLSSAHVVAGWIHCDRGDRDAAELAFSRVLDLDEENIEALRGLGDLARRRGDRDDALRHYKRLTALLPEDSALRREVRALREAVETGTPVPGEGVAEPLEAEAAAEAELELSEEHAAEFDAILEMGEETEAGAAQEPETGLADEMELPAGEMEGFEDFSPFDTKEPEPEEEPAADFAADFEAGMDLGADAEPEEEPSGEASLGIEVGAPEEEEEEEAEATVGGELELERPWEDEEEEGEDGEDVAEEDAEVYTETMADVYARQGLVAKAIEVYEHLLQQAPDNERFQARLDELRAGGGPAEPGVVGSAATSPPSPESDEDMDGLARDWAEGGAETGEISTPFAWGEETGGGAAAEVEAEDGGPPISEYFGRLLAWEPAAQAPAAGAPAAGAAPPAAESDVVPIGSLAPDEDVVPIESLFPEGGVVPIESLAPDAGGTPSAGTPSGRTPSDDAPGGDDFDQWLKKLR